MLADADVLRLQVRRQHAVPRLLHRRHHAVGADGDDAIDRRRAARARSPSSPFCVGEHRLDDVAAEVRVLRPARRDRARRVGAPDHLIGRRLDLVALEEVLALLVAGEVDRPCCRASRSALAIEKSTALPRPPPAAARSRLSGISVGAPVGPMTTTGSPFCRYAHEPDRARPARATISDSSPRSLSTHAPVSAMPSISSARAVDDAARSTRSSAAGRTGRAGMPRRRRRLARSPRRSSASAGRRPRRARSARRRAARSAPSTPRRARGCAAGSSAASSRANSSTTCG